MKKIPCCDECGENDTILTQISNFSDIKYICAACHQLKYLEDGPNKISNYAEIDDVCEECKNKYENVKSNLVMHGYKICDSCKISKTLFPI